MRLVARLVKPQGRHFCKAQVGLDTAVYGFSLRANSPVADLMPTSYLAWCIKPLKEPREMVISS